MRADRLAEASNHAAAIVLYRDALQNKLPPAASAAVNFNLGMSLRHIGDLQQALEAFEDTLAALPADSPTVRGGRRAEASVNAADCAAQLGHWRSRG